VPHAKATLSASLDARSEGAAHAANVYFPTNRTEFAV
jgi:hypothetical protein